MGRWAKSARGGNPDDTPLPVNFGTSYIVDGDSITISWTNLTSPWSAEYELLDNVAPAPILETAIVDGDFGTKELATAYSGITYAVIWCRPVLGIRRGEWVECAID